jgi:hypothetical protein
VLSYIFLFSTRDKVSPLPVLLWPASFTNNRSRSFAIGGQFFLQQNTYEIKPGYARGNVDYDIYGNGIATGSRPQTGEAYLGEALRRIGWRFFVALDLSQGILLRSEQIVSATSRFRQKLGRTPISRPSGARLTRDTRRTTSTEDWRNFFSFTLDFFSQRLLSGMNSTSARESTGLSRRFPS